MDDSRIPYIAYRLSRLRGIGYVWFGVYALAALLFLWPLTLHPTSVPFPPRSPYTDLLITHLPNAQYIRDSLSRYGQWPLWNAQIVAGQPFAADPLSGMWYPPNLLLLLPGAPLPLGFNVLLALHLAWAGYGLFRFLRAEGLGPGAALLGGLAFAGTPKLAAHLGAGHVSLVFATAWTPWLLLAVSRAASAGGVRRGAAVGLCLALLYLADVRWAFYAGLLAAAFWVTRLPPFARRREGRPVLRAAPAFAATFLALSAILTLPLAQFVIRSNRGALTLADGAAFSLPPRYFIGLVVADLGGFHEWVTYLGVVPLSLACLGLTRRTVFWQAAALCAAAFSLGSNFILFPVLFRLLPALGLLRVPPRAWFVAALAVCILAASGMDRLTGDAGPRMRRWFPLLAFGVSAFAVALALGAALVVRPYPVSLALSGSFLALGLGAMALRCQRKLSPEVALAALTLLTAGELLWVDSTLITARPLPPRAAAAQWIAGQAGLFRVYSPSYSLPPGDGLQHVDGVSPLQLAASAQFIEAASGVRASGYSVTIPAFASDDVATSNASAVPDAARLGLLNVRYVAAEFPVNLPSFELVQTFGSTHVYENTAPGASSRAWVAGAGQAEVRTWSPNRIEVQAHGPGLLVLSEVLYPGWQARVDGRPAPIELVEGLLRGVQLGEGAHDVVFEFRPLTVYLGAAFTLVGLIALAGTWRWAR